MSEDKYRAALDMAAKQLSYRALSAKMLRDKLLAKGHDEEAADYALAWLTERSLLNDALFAESVVRGYTRKGYGAARIRQELTRRGIDRDTAEAAMQTFSPERRKCWLCSKNACAVTFPIEKRSKKPLRHSSVAVLHGMISSAHSKPMAVRCRRKNRLHPSYGNVRGMSVF